MATASFNKLDEGVSELAPPQKICQTFVPMLSRWVWLGWPLLFPSQRQKGRERFGDPAETDRSPAPMPAYTVTHMRWWEGQLGGDRE